MTGNEPGAWKQTFRNDDRRSTSRQCKLDGQACAVGALECSQRPVNKRDSTAGCRWNVEQVNVS